jgi:hypothetical protein
VAKEDIVALEDVQGHLRVIVGQEAAEELEEAADVGQQLSELLLRASAASNPRPDRF